MSDTKALEILEKEDGTYLSIQGKRYSAMILLGHSEMAHNAILELAAELAGLKEQIEVMKGAKEIIDQLRADNERLTDGWMVYESISPDGELRPDISALLRDLDQLRAELDEAKNIISHALPRIHASKKNDEFCRDVHQWLSAHPEETK